MADEKAQGVLSYPAMTKEISGAASELPQGSGEKGTLSYSKMPSDNDPEAQKIIQLAQEGKFDEWADKLKAELKAMGATEDDLFMVKYFTTIAAEMPDASENRDLKGWAVRMGRFVNDFRKQQKKKGGKGK